MYEGVHLNDRYAEVSDYELINEAFVPLNDSDDDASIFCDRFSSTEPSMHEFKI